VAAPAAALQLHPPRALYPGADPLQAPAALGAGWLIVAEGLPDGDPFAGDAGRLLANMLRALQLHRHPHVHLCPLSAPTGAAAVTEPPAAVLAAALADLRPTVLLLMGRTAARAVLGRTEPLGRLRSELHQVGGIPAVVTYDAPYLLRAPDAKPAAWADLCRARALAHAAPAAA
jgi:DNA polymerase